MWRSQAIPYCHKEFLHSDLINFFSSSWKHSLLKLEAPRFPSLQTSPVPGLVLNDQTREAGKEEAGEEWGFATGGCLSVTSNLAGLHLEQLTHANVCQ